MIKEAQTIHLFRQEHDDDIADCVRYFNLEASNAAALGALPQGDHLLKVGTHKEIRVHHRRTAREDRFTATDSAMLLPTNRQRGWLMSRRDPPAAGPLASAARDRSPPGSRPPSSSVGAALGLLGAVAPVPGAHHRRPAHRPRGDAARAADRWPRWTCPARYGAADPVTTLTVFVLFLAAAVAVAACGGPPAPPPRRASVSGWRTGSRPAGPPGRSGPGSKAAYTRRGSVQPGLLDVDTAPLAEVGLLLGTTTGRGEPVVLSLEDQVGIIAATGAGKTLYLMVARRPGRPRPADHHLHETGGPGRDRGSPHRQGPGVGVRPAGRRRTGPNR